MDEKIRPEDNRRRGSISPLVFGSLVEGTVGRIVDACWISAQVGKKLQRRSEILPGCPEKKDLFGQSRSLQKLSHQQTQFMSCKDMAEESTVHMFNETVRERRSLTEPGGRKQDA